MNQFEEAYGKLNLRQKEAVDTIEGPVMVIAGPGTGKTQILTLRIANILLKTDSPADCILALTFTESAAANMRRRLVSMIGSRGYYVQISTFHGFANRLIQEYPEHFDKIIGSQNATAVDQIAMLRKIIAAGEFQHLKPFGDKFYYIQDILSAIRNLKNEGIDEGEFAKRIAHARREFGSAPDLYHEKGPHKGKMKGDYQKQLKQIEKNEELHRVYADYQSALREEKLYDFEDMILEVIRALRAREDFLLEVQERYQYILVDEHQDTNGAQNRILELLASFYPNPNLFVVGDEKQAIFRFQGASLENFIYFKKKYPEVKLISLEENYRSTQTVLDAAQSLIEHNSATLKAPLRSQGGRAERQIFVHPFRIPEAEHLFLADEIEGKIAAGHPPQEIAILYRENRDAFPIADFLEKRGIPFVVESDQNVLADSEIKKLLLLLETIEEFGSDERLIAAMHIDFLNIEPLDICRLIEKRETRRVLIAKVIAAPARLERFDLEAPERITAFYENLRRWRTMSRNQNFLPFFEAVIRESGFLAHLLASAGYFERMEKLSTLFNEVRKMVGSRSDYRLKEFIEYLNILRDHGVMVKTKVSRMPNAVRLMTAHKAKGLEFDTVFMLGACDGHWGNKRHSATFQLPFKTSVDSSLMEKNEDERRIFYMALTRARQEVHISYSSHGADGREQVPSQFIEEIRPELRLNVLGDAVEEKFMAKREAIFAPRARLLPTVHDAAFLRELFIKRGLSATALNNYLNCPWKYFYNNLVRIPRVPSRLQVYGIAVHAALQDYFEKKKNDLGIGEEFLLDRYRFHISRHPLREEDRSLILKKGERTLPAYHARYAPNWNCHVLTEFKVQAHLSEEVMIRGNLDKLEIQQNPQEVIVVDYKTKKPKSRNWLEGKTADSNGDYKRQLVFYRLLLDIHPEKKYRMVAGVIDFVEPNERGIFKQEIFEIAESEVAELRETIINSARDILSLDFWNKRCGEKKCEYCTLRDMMAASPGIVDKNSSNY